MKTLKGIFIVLIFFLASQIYSQTFQWRVLPNSPLSPTGRFEDIHFINSNTGWVIDYNGTIHKTTNAGQNWTFSHVNATNRSIGFFDSQNGILGTLSSNFQIFRTTNGGVNWIQITNLPDPVPMGICGISIVDENVAYASGVWAGPARAIKTTDKGAKWSSVFLDTSLANSLVDCYFWTADSGIAVGGYNTSFVNRNAVVLRTTNGGTSWERVHRTSRTGERCWKISFISRDIGFVSIENFTGFSYILKTTNNGMNWSEIPFGNSSEQGIGFVNENTGWIGGWIGGPTYQTTNGGLQWQLAGWGNGVNRFRFLNDTLAYAVGDRVYKYSRESVGINLISSEVPSSFQLYQNYPNPFNPITVIRYSLIENRFVTLKVYDALGNEVATLVNEKQNRGSYNYQFSTVNYQLSSGIYFYKLNAGNFSEVKRMILLK